MVAIFGNAHQYKGVIMSAIVDTAAVQTVINAFVDYSSDDKEKLACLLYVLQSEGRKTGLGHIVTDATKKIEEKLNFITVSFNY